MKILIERIIESPFSLEDVVKLIHASFNERKEQGLLFGCSEITVKEYESYAKDAIILVAYEEQLNRLLGTTAFTVKQNGNDFYAYNEFTAVSPEVKCKGIGTMLLLKEFKLAENEGCTYVLSDTSVRAKSSINLHKRVGFQLMYFTNFANNNFYSVVMRKNLYEQNNCFNNLSRQLNLFTSYIKIFLCQKPTGELKLIGKISRRIKKGVYQ